MGMEPESTSRMGNCTPYNLKCEVCGKFVSLGDIEEGLARHVLKYPDSYYTKESYETLCVNCYKKEYE